MVGVVGIRAVDCVVVVHLEGLARQQRIVGHMTLALLKMVFESLLIEVLDIIVE